MDACPIPAQSLEKYCHINGVQLERHYRERLGGYKDWPEKEYALQWLVFPENMGAHLSIGETSISNGELLR
ncbi:hypothetical protein FACS1894181_18640 [Bacteroidia bacterium]|nr:hypothetical protein FACS1894181_18640 [Bacteroidia bacterium]